MKIRRMTHVTLFAVCLALGLVLALNTGTIAAQHTRVARPLSLSALPALPVQTDCLNLAYDCGESDGESDEWSYICERGDYQAWFGFDVSEIPDSATIQSITFTALMDTESTSERTLWYDPDDSWIASNACPGNKGLTELVDTIVHSNNEPAWQAFELDLSQHDWKNDLADNYITLMLTGPSNGEHNCGEVFLEESGSGPCLIINYETAEAIPTLNEWGVIILSLFLMGVTISILRKNRADIY